MSLPNPPPSISRVHTASSQAKSEEFISLYQNLSHQDSDFVARMRNLAKQNTPLSARSLERKCPSSGRPKTFKQMRNMSPLKTNGQNMPTENSFYTNPGKFEKNISILMNRSFKHCDDYKRVLRKIYSFYTSFGDRISSDGFKASHLFKLTHDAGLLDKTVITQINLDILFQKHSLKSKIIDFEKFLLLIVELSMMKYPTAAPKESFIRLFMGYMRPLCYSLYKETNLMECDTIFKERIETETISLLMDIMPTLGRIHNKIFASEYQNLDPKVTKAKAELILPSFLKDFDICPSLINLNVGHSLLQEVIDIEKSFLTKNFTFPTILEKDKGIVFTLKRFLVFLIRVALVGYPTFFPQKQQEGPQQVLSQQDKFTLLMEKIDMSKGFADFKRSTAKLNSSLNILPITSVLRKPGNRLMGQKSLRETCNKNTFEVFKEGKFPANERTPSPKKTCRSPSSYTIGYTTYRSFTLNPDFSPTKSPCKDLKPSTVALFEGYMESLQDIFRTYCSFSGNKGGYVMKPVDITNFFRDAQLIQENTGGTSRRGSPSPKKNTEDKEKRNNLVPRLELDIFLKRVLRKAPQTNRSFEGEEELNESQLSDSRNKSTINRQITFKVFLKAIEHISLLAYPELDAEFAIKYVIKHHLEKVLNGERLTVSGSNIKEQFNQLMKMLKDPAVMDVLAFIRKKLQPFYQAHCLEKSSCINFEGFMSFNREFALFPYFISRGKLMQIFYGLASLYPLVCVKKENNIQNNAQVMNTLRKGHVEIDKRDIIDENLFIEAIPMCAAEVEEGDDRHTINKIASLFEKMIDAVEPKRNENPLVEAEALKNKRVMEEIVAFMRTKYPEMFPKEIVVSKSLKKFEDLFIEETQEKIM